MQKITSLRIMFPLDVKHRWMFVMKIAILFYGMFLKNNVCADSDSLCSQKGILIVTGKQTIPQGCHFSPKAVYHQKSGIKLCVSFKENKSHTGCCNSTDFDCEVEVKDLKGSKYSVALNKNTLSKQNIALMASPFQKFSCMPSKIYNPSDFLLSLHNCLDFGNKGIRLSQADCRTSLPYDEGACKGLGETNCNITLGPNGLRRCVSCKLPGKKPDVSHTLPSSESNNGSSENAIKIMNNLTYLLEKMGNSSTAAITIGDIKGVIFKLPQKDQTDISVGITENDDVKILEDSNDLERGFSRAVKIPIEAIVMAVKRNSKFVAVFLFPGIQQDKPNSYLINNEMLGIEMGTEISNLSESIDIHFTNMDKKGNVASCRSWDGKGRKMWITDGCQTNETNDRITCHCSHLTFFAILMSPPPGNITSSDFRSLTYITSIGCGLSMFFLTVGLFMHCLIRKGKASQATKILINLFVAMFAMNLSFLVNESVAKIGNFSVCVAMAAVMHYSLLATFTWFFIEALHLCFNLWKLPSGIKYYMTKICITGWVTPAVVVVALLASKKYDMLFINTNDGNSVKMCWISDAAVHQGVNVGYYAIVFIFTLSMFIITVWQIVLFKRTTGKTQDSSSTKTNIFSVLGLFLLLGITWAFAFFSHGPLLIPSYYIFTILNSFQGFFLFIYYYNSSKIVGEVSGSSVSTSGSMATSNTVVTSPYQ